MKISSPKGFTFIEVILVVSILAIVLVIIITFWINKYLEWDSSKRITYEHIWNNLNGSWRNSTSWYWGKSISEWIKDEKTLLPEDFLVLFRRSIDNDNLSWYYYTIETQNRKSWSNDYTRVINKNKHEYNSPSIYLKEIKAKVNESDLGVDLSSFAVWFKNPTWKVSFYIDNNFFIEEWVVLLSEDSGNTINEWIKPIENNSYNIVELLFYGNDNEKKFTYKIYRDKWFYVLLD